VFFIGRFQLPLSVRLLFHFVDSKDIDVKNAAKSASKCRKGTPER
jgi:hypothetical protein